MSRDVAPVRARVLRITTPSKIHLGLLEFVPLFPSLLFLSFFSFLSAFFTSSHHHACHRTRRPAFPPPRRHNSTTSQAITLLYTPPTRTGRAHTSCLHHLLRNIAASTNTGGSRHPSRACLQLLQPPWQHPHHPRHSDPNPAINTNWRRVYTNTTARPRCAPGDGSGGVA